jgi:Flp pilus assembly protein TadG
MTAASRVGDSQTSHMPTARSELARRRCPGRALRRGIAASEFAIIAPFLTILILGTFELSRGIMVKETLNDAARRGCRIGIQPLKANSDVTTGVNNILTDNSISTGSATITVQVNGTTADCNTAIQNDKVTVKVSIPTSATFWVSTYFLKSAAIESDSVTMLKQQ